NIRRLENVLRKGKGYQQVGTVYNEILLFEAIHTDYGRYGVLYQHSPPWLGRQRFDVYIQNLNIAIEYNGIQHYKPVDFFGGEEGFADNQRRDEQKKELCKQNGCLLLEVKYDENFEL